MKNGTTTAASVQHKCNSFTIIMYYLDSLGNHLYIVASTAKGPITWYPPPPNVKRSYSPQKVQNAQLNCKRAYRAIIPFAYNNLLSAKGPIAL